MQKKNLFDLPISIGTYEMYVEESSSRRHGYSCFLNSHMIYENYNRPDFDRILKNAEFVLPDGMPVTYSMRIFVQKQQERIAGNDVIFSLIERAKIDKLKIFILGTTPEILSKISKRLIAENVLHRTYSPTFSPIEEYDFEEQAEIINAFNPDLILVGLGCPKQEIWMYNMKERVNAAMFGLGGALLLYAGVDSRAPLWMRKLALEWVYRLAMEPKRLLKRYFITNLYFLYLFCCELIKRRRK